jgi:hypothetical protein
VANPAGIRRAVARLAPALMTLAGPGLASAQDPLSAVDALPSATTRLDKASGRLVIELPPTTVPGEGTVRTPVYRVAVPLDVSVHGFAVEVVDEAGRGVPRDRLHHVLMTDPVRRELFLPLALPVFGASSESPDIKLPKHLFGMPLPAGDRYLAAAMLANPEAEPRRLTVRLQLSYTRPGRLLPLFRVFPWTMDVMFPLGGVGGRHDFDLPPGCSVHSWEGSPHVAGTIVAIGGHAHDHVSSIQLLDTTTGDTLWHATPIHDARGRLQEIPVARLYRWHRLGVRIDSSHTYRLTVVYDNPTGRAIPFGGMGSVVGLIIPARGVSWPAVSPDDPVYRAQLGNLLNNMAGAPGADAGHMHAGGGARPGE